MDPNRPPQQPAAAASSSSPSSSAARDQHQDEEPPSPSAARPALEPPWPPRPPPQHPNAGPSRMPVIPATPDAVEESDTEYFPALRDSTTARSRSSSLFPPSRPASTTGPDLARPARDQARRPSIRIRRGSNVSLYQQQQQQQQRAAATVDHLAPPAGQVSSSEGGGRDARHRNRPRSISQPISVPAPVYPDASVARHPRRVPQIALPRLTEEGPRPTMADLGIGESPISPTISLPEEALGGAGDRRPSSAGSEPTAGKLNRKRRISRLFWPGFSARQPGGGGVGGGPSQDPSAAVAQRPYPGSDELDEELVDWLDIIDPEVQALSTLTNVQNSLFIPDLGGLINRRPTYVLSHYDAEQLLPITRPRREEERPLPPDVPAAGVQPEPSEAGQQAVDLQRTDTITSRLTDSHYAALPHGMTLEGWSAAEKLELDDHVRHMLHSRRSRFKRTMKGFGQYVRRPLGFFVTLYATLITLFGLAWVLFLIGWIYVGDKQVYAIHIIDSVLVALFAIMGDGLAPFRAVDTYHLIFVVHYSRIIAKAKKRQAEPRSRRPSHVSQVEGDQAVELAHTGRTSTEGLATHGQRSESVERIAKSTGDAGVDGEPPVAVKNTDLELAKPDAEYDEDGPLTYAQWNKFRHHQKKIAKSHSFYKPDETFTHNPFHLSYLIAIIVLLDCHSCLQISLGATTWGIDYHHRPFVITTVILCVSITCNLVAGLVITIGDRKTRKKDVIELLNRQELTGDAIRHLVSKRAKEQSRSHDIGTEENQRQGLLVKDED